MRAAGKRVLMKQIILAHKMNTEQKYVQVKDSRMGYNEK